MKLTLKTSKPAADGAAPEASNGAPTSATAPSSGGGSIPKLNLKFKPFSASPSEFMNPPAVDAPKPKRKYTKKPKVDENGQPLVPAKPGPKKRAREENGEDVSPAAKRKPKPTAKSLAMVQESDDDDEAMLQAPPVSAPKRPAPSRTQSVKLSFKPKGSGSAPQRTSTAILKVKGAGKPPPRPPGVGYDSEAEEAEVDPAVESQFVLRMIPGPDCDLLRKAIEEKTIGKSAMQGGPGVYFRFFDREGRRAMVTIQGRQYAASMVELPCVIESMKSWNKKDWVKTADVCQMLLVLGRVKDEEEAKKFPRPKEVDPDSHRYPHGLTPPMQWVRKRRFRPRKSYLDVERIETSTDQLVFDDENAVQTRYELVDSEHSSEDEDESTEEDAEGEDDDMVDETQLVETPAAIEEDENDLSEILHAGFMADEDEVVGVDANADEVNALFGGRDTATIKVETPATSHDVAMHALGANGNIVLEPETAASTPGAATSADDDDDDDAESDEDAEVDEAAAELQQQKQQWEEELRDIEQEIEKKEAQIRQHTNPIYVKRVQGQLDKMKADRAVKRRQLGFEED